METGFFFIDYFSFGTDILTDYIIEEMLSVPNRKPKNNRFYINVLKCGRCLLQSEPRIKTLNTFSLRFHKDFINESLEYNLPTDAKIQRVDFAFDTDNEDFAKSFVISEFDYSVYSKSGTTHYYGERSSAILERVYFLNERGRWRYELEYKPREGRECKEFDKTNSGIQELWYNICRSKTLTGRVIRGEFQPITRARREYIDMHFESPFVNIHIDFYRSLNDSEREYFEKKCNTAYTDRAPLWKKEITAYKTFKRFFKDI